MPSNKATHEYNKQHGRHVYNMASDQQLVNAFHLINSNKHQLLCYLGFIGVRHAHLLYMKDESIYPICLIVIPEYTFLINKSY